MTHSETKMDAPHSAEAVERGNRLPLMLGILGLALAVLLAIGLTCTSLASYDGPALIHYGGLTFELGHFARFSDFAAVTDADAIDVMHHQWLAEIVFHLCWSLFDVAGLWGLNLLVLFAVCAGLLRAGQGRVPLWVLAGLFSAVSFSMVSRILLRGDFLSIGLLAFLLSHLLVSGREGDGRRLYWLVPIQLLWINIHPFAVVGLGIMSLFAAEEVLSTVLFEKADRLGALRKRKHVFLCWGAMLLASMATPYGPRTLLLFFEGLSGPSAEMLEIFGTIYEFDSLLSVYQNEFLFVWKVLHVLAGIVMLLALRRRRFWLAGAFAASTAAAFLHCRMLAFSAVITAFVLVAFLPSAWDVFRRRLGEATAWLRRFEIPAAVAVAVFTGVVAVGALTDDLYIRNGESRVFGRLRANLQHPWRAADFVRDKGLSGNCFNNYDCGSFLLFSLPAENRVFIDTQFLYTPDFYFRYRRIMSRADPFEPVVRQYGIGFVLLRHTSSDTGILMRKLLHDDRWALVYLDECAVVFVPVNETTNALVEGFRVNLDDGDPKAFLSRGKDADPRAKAAMAEFFLKAERPAKAKEIYLRLLEDEPRLFVAWNNLGVILLREGDDENALQCFLRSLERNESYERTRKNLRRLLARGRLNRYNPDVQRAREYIE